MVERPSHAGLSSATHWFGPRRNVAGPGSWPFSSSGACAAHCLGAFVSLDISWLFFPRDYRQVAVLQNPSPNALIAGHNAEAAFPHHLVPPL